LNSPAHDSPQRKLPRDIKSPHSMFTMRHDRCRSITEAAYFFSERRGFAPGRELDDWLAAENQIDTAVRLGGALTRERTQLPNKIGTGTNLSNDNPVLMLVAEAEQHESMAHARTVRNTGRSNLVGTPIEICTDEVWARGGAAVSSLLF
jgi:hypothetical protein